MDDRAPLSAFDLGIGFLGSGGGGVSRSVRMILDASGVTDFRVAPVTDQMLAVGVVGSVEVFEEVLPNGAEARVAVESLARWTGRDFTGVIPLQIGGVCGLTAVLVAEEFGLPVCDGDLVGRAVARLDQTSLDGGAVSVGLGGTNGVSMAFTAGSFARVEDTVRSVLDSNSGWVFIAVVPAERAIAQAEVVAGSVSRALACGRALAGAQSASAMNDRERALGDADIVVLAQGRVDQVVVDASRRHRVSFSIHERPARRSVRIEADSEYLLVLIDGAVAASTPEIVNVLDRTTLEPILATSLREGTEVVVVSAPAAKWWTARPERLSSIDMRAHDRIRPHPTPDRFGAAQVAR